MRILFFIILLGFSSKASSQDVMMQGWFWDYPKTAAGENWTDTLKNIATDMGDAGFTHIWLPPFSRASFGSNSNGYDPQDLYDLGEYGQGAGRLLRSSLLYAGPADHGYCPREVSLHRK